MVDGVNKVLEGAHRNYGKLLTPREIEVLIHVAKGEFFNDVAQGLGISRRTLDAHTMNIRKKLGAKNSAHMIAIALRSGIIT